MPLPPPRKRQHYVGRALPAINLLKTRGGMRFAIPPYDF
jgi:hypothetical protein